MSYVCTSLAQTKCRIIGQEIARDSEDFDMQRITRKRLSAGSEGQVYAVPSQHITQKRGTPQLLELRIRLFVQKKEATLRISLMAMDDGARPARLAFLHPVAGYCVGASDSLVRLLVHLCDLGF